MQSEDGNPPRGLDQRLATWVRRGLVTPEQAEAIWHFEHGSAAYPGQPGADAAAAATPFGRGGGPTTTAFPAPPFPNAATGLPPAATSAAPPRRIPVVAEVLAYLGGILATVAALLVIGPLWDSLGIVGQLLLLAAVAGLLVGVGGWLFRLDERSATTMGSVLWLGGLLAVGAFGGKLFDTVFGVASEAALLAASLVGIGTATAMWWVHRNAVQLTALVLSSGLVTLAFVQEFSRFDVTTCGVALAGLGLVWLFLGWSRSVAPDEVATSLGAVSLVAGSLLVSATTGVTGQVFANLVAVGLIVAGATLGRTELLAVGAVGLLIALPILITGLAGGTIGVPLGLLVAGAVLLMTAQRYYRRAPRV
ncbi:MAG: hypothetical protein ACTHMW_12250 [Actinomycetes bacterium]